MQAVDCLPLLMDYEKTALQASHVSYVGLQPPNIGIYIYIYYTDVTELRNAGWLMDFHTFFSELFRCFVGDERETLQDGPPQILSLVYRP